MSQSLSPLLVNGTGQPSSEKKKKRSRNQETGPNKRRRKDLKPDLNDSLPVKNGGDELPGKGQQSSGTLVGENKIVEVTKKKKSKHSTTTEYSHEPKTLEVELRDAPDVAVATENSPPAPVDPPITKKKKKNQKYLANEEGPVDGPDRSEAQPLESGLPSDSVYGGQILPSEAVMSPVKKKKKKKRHIEQEDPEPVPADIDHAETKDDDEPVQNIDEMAVEEMDIFEQPTASIPPDLPSPFHSVRLSLYVPLYAISLSTATNSLLSTHLAPLLLTYFPPAHGIVLSFSNPSISARAPKGPGQTAQAPSISTLTGPTSTTVETTLPTRALAGDDQGTSWVWLTTTLLIFRPTRHTEMQGHVNICSEGFIGLVLYNYFQTGIARSRIPKFWRWEAAGWDTGADGKKSKKGKKTKLNDHEERVKDSQESEAFGSSDAMAIEHMDFDADYGEAQQNSTAADVQTSHFVTPAGDPVLGAQRFRVVDVDVVPVSGGNYRSTKYSLQIQGTLLDEEAEEKVRREEKIAYERLLNRRARRVEVAAVEDGETEQAEGMGVGMDAMMSGGLGVIEMEEE